MLFALTAALLFFSTDRARADAGQSAPYGDNPSAGDYAQTADARIYYESYGSGKPVFVFHGGGAFGNSGDIAPIINLLRKDFRVIAVSTRGSGRSEAGHSPLTFETKAGDMLAVMRKVTDKPAPVFGFSDGGYIAYMLASLYPEAVERVVTVGAGTVKPGFYPPSKVSLRDLKWQNPGLVDRLCRNMPEPGRLEELINATLESWHTMDFSQKVLGAIKCPCLLIAGDGDSDAPLLTMIEAHQLIPRSRLFIVPRASHGAFFDAPELVLPAIVAFMKKDAADLYPAQKLPFNDQPHLWDKIARQ